MDKREKLAIKIAWISLICNVVLTVSKVFIGNLFHSEALFADGIHSAADVFATVFVLLVIKFANRPPDKEHPYGHGKAEVIVSGLVGLILIATTVYIVVEAITGIFDPDYSPSLIALFVAFVSYVSKEILYRSSNKIARKHNNKAIEAIALDHKADIVASLAAMVGIFVSLIGETMHYSFLLYGDSIASMVVAYMIFKIAKKMISESFSILLDRNLDDDILNIFREIITSYDDVKRIDRLRAREHGNDIFVDLRISIAYDKTIKEGHDLSKEIKSSIVSSNDRVKEVLIHLNPYYETE